MSRTFKVVTVVGTSSDSLEDAIKNAVHDAGDSLRNLGWFEVKELRGRIKGGDVAEYQAKVDIGFKIERD